MSEQARSGKAESPCPPWCSVDHEKFVSHQGSNRDVLRLGPEMEGYAVARLTQHGESRPFIYVEAARPPKALSARVTLGLRDASGLAAVLDVLADATPDECKEFAAEIRAAVKLIGTEGDEVAGI